MNSEKAVTFLSGDLELEGRFRISAVPACAIVMHPHPQYGGDMDNHVVEAIVRAFADAGYSTLRFNFRGVGQSEGEYGDGSGEADDARAAINFVKHELGDLPAVTLAGYSFGAMIAAETAGAGTAAILLVSPPVGIGRFSALPDGVPALIVTGDQDPIAPAEAVRSMASANVEVKIVMGADHGWWPGIEELSRHVQAFARPENPA